MRRRKNRKTWKPHSLSRKGSEVELHFTDGQTVPREGDWPGWGLWTVSPGLFLPSCEFHWQPELGEETASKGRGWFAPIWGSERRQWSGRRRSSRGGEARVGGGQGWGHCDSRQLPIPNFPAGCPGLLSEHPARASLIDRKRRGC